MKRHSKQVRTEGALQANSRTSHHRSQFQTVSKHIYNSEWTRRRRLPAFKTLLNQIRLQTVQGYVRNGDDTNKPSIRKSTLTIFTHRYNYIHKLQPVFDYVFQNVQSDNPLYRCRPSTTNTNHLPQTRNITTTLYYVIVREASNKIRQYKTLDLVTTILYCFIHFNIWLLLWGLRLGPH